MLMPRGKERIGSDQRHRDNGGGCRPGAIMLLEKDWKKINKLK